MFNVFIIYIYSHLNNGIRFFFIFLYFFVFPLFYIIFSNYILLFQLFNYYILIFFMSYLSQLSLSFFSHQFILVICVFIVFFISVIFIFLFFYQHNNTIFNSNFLLEYFWTFIPVVLVVILFVPLFFFNNFLSSEFDFNYFVIGNQWFWDFIYLDNFVFTTSLFNYDFLYNSYPTVYLPALHKLNFYLTWNDVLHAFSLPHLYTMIDLVPGTLHTLNLFFPYIGVYTVYCAQICGINHWAMPFIVNAQ